ncbi:sulfotransferase 1B1-like [Ornithodoros turicata]|uniref:sulfotransferase 1B1-like n=1 Tax=Ornithodoros turicata TaxID=34597 RepID=UPI0031398991
MGDSRTHPAYEEISGLRFPSFYPPHSVTSGLNYKPRDDDIFLITYARCGTSWMQQVLYLVLHNGQAPADAIQFYIKCPLLELEGSEAVDAMPRPGIITSQLSYDRIPKSSSAKYVLLLRDPRDVCVSMFHYLKGFPSYLFTSGKFTEFVELFVEDETDYEGYFNHIESWWSHRNDPNVFFVTFEEMQLRPADVVERLVRFLGITEFNEDVVKRVLKKSSAKYMREHTNTHMEEFFYTPFETLMGDTRLSEGILAFHATVQCSGLLDAMSNVRCVKRGVSGVWKGVLNEEQEQRIKDRLSQVSAEAVEELCRS